MHNVNRYIDLAEKIREKTYAYRQKLETLELALKKERQEAFHKRRFKYILFLSLEKNVYSFSLAELESLLNEDVKD